MRTSINLKTLERKLLRLAFLFLPVFCLAQQVNQVDTNKMCVHFVTCDTLYDMPTSDGIKHKWGDFVPECWLTDSDFIIPVIDIGIDCTKDENTIPDSPSTEQSLISLADGRDAAEWEQNNAGYLFMSGKINMLPNPSLRNEPSANHKDWHTFPDKKRNHYKALLIGLAVGSVAGLVTWEITHPHCNLKVYDGKPYNGVNFPCPK